MYDIIDSIWFWNIWIVKIKTSIWDIKFYIWKWEWKSKELDEMVIAMAGKPFMLPQDFYSFINENA